MPPKKKEAKQLVITDPCKQKVIYLDNNATTKLCPEAKVAMVKWLEARANPSSDSVISIKSRQLIDGASKFMLKHCGTTDKKYTVLWTSGASESNCLILRSVAEAFKLHKGITPHIITSATEHKSIIQCCNSLQNAGTASITFIEPNAYGCVSPTLVASAITSNTALVSIMAANNEIGCINNIKEIGKLVHSKEVPFHTDAVQVFGKYRILLPKSNVDALSMSFHKVYGPMGLGMLIINNQLIEGYGLKGQISGTQQKSLRGGTENVPAIAGAVASIQATFNNRNEKNKKLLKLKKQIIYELEQELPRGSYKRYFAKDAPTENEFILLGPEDGFTNQTLPNTLLLAFVKNKEFEGKEFKRLCNTKIKTDLNKKGIIVSIGSACSTSSEKASHVLYAIKAPDKIRQGVIRVSLSDSNTPAEVSIFTKTVLASIRKQMPF